MHGHLAVHWYILIGQLLITVNWKVFIHSEIGNWSTAFTQDSFTFPMIKSYFIAMITLSGHFLFMTQCGDDQDMIFFSHEKRWLDATILRCFLSISYHVYVNICLFIFFCLFDARLSVCVSMVAFSLTNWKPKQSEQRINANERTEWKKKRRTYTRKNVKKKNHAKPFINIVTWVYF